MEECILFPSPNWFQASGLSVSKDGWLIYGGPSKSLCVLEPFPHDYTGVVQGDCYRAHVLHRAHAEKIVSVDINPQWPEKKAVLTGSFDGSVKQWDLQLINNNYQFKCTLSHDVHLSEKEEVVGVGYSNEVYAITVGCFGNIVKWDLNSNVVKKYNQFLKNFKPTCISCSQHILLNLAVGTKQGVIFVLDLNGSGNIVYKVRGQDDEIVNANWCPQYEVVIRKYLKDSDKRVSANEKKAKVKQVAEEAAQNLNQSAVTKNLPEDSFDESVVVEDDMFDIYKDHEMDAFGPKKYQPENILVTVKEEVKIDENYLAECLKLKEVIMTRKNEPESNSSITSLVEAFEKTHIENQFEQHASDISQADSNAAGCSKSNRQRYSEASVHVHKHLLATIGKQGGVRIWSKTGRLVGSCAVTSGNKNQRTKQPTCTTLLWYKPDTLLLADGKSQLLQCNPLKVDCKSKLEFRVIHSLHKRGLYSIVSDAPKVQTPENSTKEMLKQWSVWTIAQDRTLIRYSLESNDKISVHATCGGFLYMIQSCPYDAKKVAVSVGDGAVRVWEADTTDEDDTRLSPGIVSTYWQNVQGKVLSIAWHPTKENLLAFGTAESRVGLIDTNGKEERAAKTLVPALSGGVYSMWWGDGDRLYVSAGGQLVVYHTSRPDQHPENIAVSVEGQQWTVCCIRRLCNALVVGSTSGAVAVLDETQSFKALAANYVYTKMIYAVECHPQQTSESNNESAYKNLIAVASLDNQNTITILEYGDKEDGTKQLQTWKVLSGHKGTVLQVIWNPHRDELLLSTSQDSSIRVWDIVQGACISIFGGHVQSALSAAWNARPQMYDQVLSGGSDCTLRLWRASDFPSNNYNDTDKAKVLTKKEKRKLYKQKKSAKKAEEEKVEPAKPARTGFLEKGKTSKRYLLPVISRQIINCQLKGARKMLQNYIKNNSRRVNGNMEIINDNSNDQQSLKAVKDSLNEEVAENNDTLSKDLSAENAATNTKDKGAKEKDTPTEESNTSTSTENNSTSAEDKDDFLENMEYGTDFIKIFGSTNNVNEILDIEMEHHLVSSNLEAWIMLSIFRGHIDAMMQFANSRDLLCPYLVSISPCVSFKYWKDATQLYLAQIERLIAKGEEEKLNHFKNYGGIVYRKVGSLLSVHDIKGAVATLIESRLFKEAYILCRTRHMDSIAQEILHKWAHECYITGNWPMAAICHLALGNLSEAATILGKSNQPDCLCLAADIAKMAGHNIFADHIEERKSYIKSKESTAETEDILEELPTRVELLMKNKTNEIEVMEEQSLPEGNETEG